MLNSVNNKIQKSPHNSDIPWLNKKKPLILTEKQHDKLIKNRFVRIQRDGQKLKVRLPKRIEKLRQDRFET